MSLTAKQQRFVEEYLVDLNATQAALRAGYSEKTSYSSGQRLLKNVEIQGAIGDAQEKRSERTEITSDWVLEQAAKLHQRCMQEVDPVMDRKGNQIRDDEGNPLFVFNAAGAAKALELVGKHVNIQAFRDQLGVTGTINLTVSSEDAEL